MRRLKTSVICIIVLILIICFSSCSGRKDIVITDCITNKVVSELSTKEDKTEAVMLTDVLNKCKETNKTTKTIDTKEKYQVHFIDPKDSQYDIWFYIYITDENDVYAQFDKKKMENLNDFNKEHMDYNLKECTGMTANEFHSVLNK